MGSVKVKKCCGNCRYRKECNEKIKLSSQDDWGIDNRAYYECWKPKSKAKRGELKWKQE